MRRKRANELLSNKVLLKTVHILTQGVNENHRNLEVKKLYHCKAIPLSENQIFSYSNRFALAK